MEQNNCASLQVALKLKPLKNMNIKVTQRPRERVIFHNLGKVRHGLSVTRVNIKKKQTQPALCRCASPPLGRAIQPKKTRIHACASDVNVWKHRPQRNTAI